MLLSAILTVAFAFPIPQDAPPLPSIAEGMAKVQDADWAAAAKIFEARVQANPNDAQSWFQLGIARHHQSEWESALAAHEKAAGFPATARLGSYNAACAAARLGRSDDAFAWLQKAVGAGWGDRKMLATDADLASLREDKRFASVLPPLLEGADLFVEMTDVLYTLVGESGGDQFGWVARVVGDLDGDGVHDFASTAPSHKGWSGAVYVYSGKSSKLLFRLDGQPGWVLGNSVEGRVDVNADGVMDVIAGAPSFGTNPGQVLVASGKDGALLHTLSKGTSGDQFGMKVAGVRDLDGDGHDEIAVGAPGEGPGKVYVYSGKNGTLLATLQGEAAGDQFGSSIDSAVRADEEGESRMLIVGAFRAGEGDRGRAYLYHFQGTQPQQIATVDSDEKGANLGQYFASFLGDVDGDGVSDVYVSDFNHACKGPSTGQAYVHSGETGQRIRTFDGRNAGEGFGTSQAACGDVNHDGVADLCIGAWQNADVGYATGKIYVVSGKDGSDLATWTSKQLGDTLGFDAVGIGDVNGDGNHDFLVTAAWSTVQFGRQGRVFVIAGPEMKPQ